MKYYNYDFDWDDENLLHATKHGVSANEAEQCFENEYLVIAKPKSVKIHGEQRYYLLGRTNGGFPVFLVFKKLSKDKVRIISARRMTKAEEEKYDI
jgi:uncharacterized DUF497 family protein